MSAHAFLPPPIPFLLPVLLAASLCLTVPVLPVLLTLAPGGGRALLAAVDMVSIAGPADRDPRPATRALIDNKAEQDPASPGSASRRPWSSGATWCIKTCGWPTLRGFHPSRVRRCISGPSLLLLFWLKGTSPRGKVAGSYLLMPP